MSTAILQSAALYDFGDIHMKVSFTILIAHRTVTPFLSIRQWNWFVFV